MADSTQPFADPTYYAANGFGETFDKLDKLLAQASRIVRAEALQDGVDIGQRITDGLLDADLVSDVVCGMVQYAHNGPAIDPSMMGANSVQAGAGPFQKTVSYSQALGSLSFTKVYRLRLGLGKQHAFEADLVAARLS